MATNKVILGGVTKIDLTDKTVAANTMLNGTTSLDRSGAAITGNIASQSGSTVTPTESVQTAVPANTYTTGAVQVGAIPSNYVGSGVPQRTSADLTVAGTTVTAPAGYYSSAASAQVESEDFIITMVKNQDDEWTADKTYAQIADAYTAGKNIITEIENPWNQDLNAVYGFYFDGAGQMPYFCAYIFEEASGTYGFGAYLYTDYWLNPVDVENRVEQVLYDSASADALAADVRAGKYFVNANGEQVGSAVTRTASDLTASGATVTVPAGIYDSQVTKAIANGSATTPATTITANPTISVNSSGLITASTSATQSVTPTVSAGYVSSGTAGTVTVSGSKTQQLTTQAGTTITPTESEQTAVAAQRYTTGAVKVAAIPSNYVGSGITRRDSDDITENDGIFTIPAGYYEDAASAWLPNAVIAYDSYTVNQSTGRVQTNFRATTSGYATGMYSGHFDLPTQAATTITPTTSSQTAVAAGKYTTGTITVAAMPSGTAGTPTATKSAVSNHAVTVTPSVTNTTGYITGGTKTGTAVSVTAAELVSGTLTISSSGTKDVTNYASATVAAGTEGTPTATKGAVSNHSVTITPSVTNSAGYITGSTKTGTAVTVTAAELVSGTKSITANGSSIDVTDYQYVDVNVSGGGGVLVEDTLDANGGIIRTITAADVVTVGQKTITQNGTYAATSDGYDGYSQVTVNVSGSSPNLQTKTNINPTTSSQTITADPGYDGLASVQINAMPSGTAGTPTATKGAVSNHSVTVTPSVTNSTGYITGGTKTGTGVTVSASELVSGSQTITDNGTVNVTNLASVNVQIPFVTYYTGTTDPSPGLGSNGDIYLKVVS